MTINRKNLVKRRHLRIRKKVQGTAERPRLAVYRSNLHIYAQVIGPSGGETLASASTVEADVRQQMSFGGNAKAAAVVGRIIAERAKAKGITKVAFDRSGFKYHGRIKALADAARESGLEF